MTWLSDQSISHLRAVTDRPDLSGTRYTLVREIARGGIGVIYEARDRELERSVALKVLAPEMSGADAIARMRHEAITIARLEHPGIVPIHDAGELPDGRAFYAMKLVRGVTLADYVRDHTRTDVLRVFLRVCEAVAFAHAHDVVHRDLKPDNIMVGEFGETLVMDWGVARAGQPEDSKVIVGTRGFMPPEQQRGESDARSDVFALGRILEFSLPKDRSKPLRSIIAKATAENPTERYADANEIGQDVIRLLDGEPVRAHREGPIDIAVRLISRHRALIALIVAYLVMRAAILIWARV